MIPLPEIGAALALRDLYAALSLHPDSAPPGPGRRSAGHRTPREHPHEAHPLPTAALAATLLAATPLLGACQTDTAGVTSTYRTQTATVMAGVQDATEAAAEVLEDYELRDVTSNATEVDGQAMGMKADGTEVNVYARPRVGER